MKRLLVVWLLLAGVFLMLEYAHAAGLRQLTGISGTSSVSVGGSGTYVVESRRLVVNRDSNGDIVSIEDGGLSGGDSVSFYVTNEVDPGAVTTQANGRAEISITFTTAGTQTVTARVSNGPQGYTTWTVNVSGGGGGWQFKLT